MSTNCTEDPIMLYEVWDTLRCCVLACFTTQDAAAAFIEPDGLSKTCVIREYALGC